MEKLKPGDDPETMPLSHAEFWIQIHSLPIGLRSAVVVSAIGSFLGNLIETDDRNFDGSMRTYYRVRVNIDVTKPFKKQMKLKKDNGTWALIDFRYERLPTFCFLCGIIGHGDRFCPKIVQGVDVQTEKPFGAWLRASSRRNAPTAGQRWVAPELDSERKDWRAPGLGPTGMMNTENNGTPVNPNTDGQLALINNNANVQGPDVTIIEQKRKRVDDDSTKLDHNQTPMECETSMSKNELRAGLAMQARREL